MLRVTIRESTILNWSCFPDTFLFEIGGYDSPGVFFFFFGMEVGWGNYHTSVDSRIIVIISYKYL